MNNLTLRALKGSIEKWEMIRDGDLEDDGRDNCPLCHVFYYHGIDLLTACIGCPVFASTNTKYCQKTPYMDYRNEYSARRPELSNAEWTRRRRELAQVEVDFLVSLLPEDDA